MNSLAMSIAGSVLWTLLLIISIGGGAMLLSYLLTDDDSQNRYDCTLEWCETPEHAETEKNTTPADEDEIPF